MDKEIEGSLKPQTRLMSVVEKMKGVKKEHWSVHVRRRKDDDKFDHMIKFRHVLVGPASHLEIVVGWDITFTVAGFGVQAYPSKALPEISLLQVRRPSPLLSVPKAVDGGHGSGEDGPPIEEAVAEGLRQLQVGGAIKQVPTAAEFIDPGSELVEDILEELEIVKSLAEAHNPARDENSGDEEETEPHISNYEALKHCIL
ncbi:hypothetical protein BJ878DRAFT_543526 [Calycina marina]|uniref:Uncharacterized protein n=1 Tax=Calycina marina TaxID=1763456 RepID=A0A9P8CDL9_9HELO|nr:hypothetical protein BJ878DRAFT_543526 [Calycina marina]